MADIGNMSLQQLREYQEKAQNDIDSIMFMVSSNKFAMFSLCQRPDFLELCQKEYGIGSSEIKQFIRDRLGVDVPSRKERSPTDIAQLVRDRTCVQSDTRQTKSKYAQIRNHLFMCAGVLDGNGYSDSPEDKDVSQFEWLTPVEYMDFWEKASEVYFTGEHICWTSIYAFRVKDSRGQYKESVFTGRGNGEVYLKDLPDGTDKVGCYSFSLVNVCMKLMTVLQDMFGDRAAQELYNMSVASWRNEPGCDRRYGDFFIPLSYLVASGKDVSNPYDYRAIPGVVMCDGEEDELIMSKSLVQSVRSADYSMLSPRDFYYKVHNEGFYVSTALKLVSALSDDNADSAVSDFCDRIQFFVRRGYRY